MGQQLTRRDWLKRALILTGASVLAPHAFAFDTRGVASPDVFHRRLRFTLSLRNPTADTLWNQDLWLYLPASTPPSQELRTVEVSGIHEVLADPLGQRILQLHFPEVAPYATQVVTVTNEVVQVRNSSVVSLHEPQAWLGPEVFVETRDPEISELAGSLKHEIPMETAEAIFNWVRDHLTYAGYVADDWGAKAALQRRQGDCTDFAYLAVALARVNGIPARVVGGYVVSGDAVLRGKDYHNWAELYVDGAWRLVDAQKGRWLAAPDHYVAFHYARDAVLNPIGRAHRFRVDGSIEVAL